MLDKKYILLHLVTALLMRALAAEMDDLRESAAAASSWAWLPDVVELRTHLEGCS